MIASASPLPLALAALAPGLWTWWTGRRLVTLAADPALPELLMARQQRLVKVLAVTLAILIVLGGRHLYWSVALLVLTLFAGGYPLRRRLLGETATLPVYLWRSIRSVIGGVGFWFLLLWTPAIVLAIDPARWPLVLVLLALLLWWEHSYQWVWLRLHDAEPLSTPDLDPRIARIVERAGIAAPALYRIGAPGTRFVNALAFPSATRPAIGLGNALIELLEPDEIAAIYAHELAHIEQFGPRVVRRLQMVTRLLIVAAITIPLIVRWLAPDVAWWTVWLFPLAMVFVLVQRAKKSQQREHESDLRAAALCGDAESVARALIKVHVHGFIPRRWAVDFERSASHPSLARRIQALRGDSAEAIASIGAPAVFPTARDGSFVAFDDTRAWWFDGVPTGTAGEMETLSASASSVRSVAWPDLLELRVTVVGDSRALRASHRNGDTWSVPLSPAHVGEVQQALDRVDVRLHRELGRQPLSTARPLAAAIALSMVLAGHLGVVLIPASLVLWRPVVPALAALGAMAVARALFGLVLPDAGFAELPLFGLGIAAVLGVVALVVAWQQRRDAAMNARLTMFVLVGLVVLLLLSGVPAVWGRDAAELATSDIIPALVATLLGITAVLALSDCRRTRWWGAAVGALAAAVGTPGIIASALFEPVPELASVRMGLEPVAQVSVESANGLRLSPGGTRFLVQQFDPRAYERSRGTTAVEFVLGDSSGIRRRIEATGVEFTDDEHVLVLRVGDGTLELRHERADVDSTLWIARLPDVYGPQLIVGPKDATWAVVGEEVGTDSLLVATGSSGSAEVRYTRHAPMDSIAGTGYLVFDNGSRVLVPAFDAGSVRRLPMVLMMLTRTAPDMVVWEVTAAGHRKLGTFNGYPQCGSVDDGVALCLVRDRGNRAVAVNATGPESALRLPGLRELYAAHPGPGGALTMSGADRVLHLDLVARRLVEFDLPDDWTIPVEAHVAGTRLATLSADSATTSLRLYRVTQR